MIRIEFKKLKNSKLFLPIILLPIFSVGYGTVNYYINREILNLEWISLWTQVYLFYGLIFFPALIGIVCAYIWNNEHKNNDFKLLFSSSKSFYNIILSKICVVFIISFIIQIYFLILFNISGSFLNFNSQFPFEILYFIIIINLFNISIICIQCYLSLKINSFAIPVALSIVYALLGMLTAAFAKIPELKYIFSNANMTFVMNHFPYKSFSKLEYFKMMTYNFLLTIFFIKLQVRELKNKLK